MNLLYDTLDCLYFIHASSLTPFLINRKIGSKRLDQLTAYQEKSSILG